MGDGVLAWGTFEIAPHFGMEQGLGLLVVFDGM